jgi:hypothetical protein
VTRSQYFGRDDRPQPRDAWREELPDPNPDNSSDTEFDWLWARSVQDSRLPHEINDRSASAVLDAHDWRWLPFVHESHVSEIIHEELLAMTQARRMRELPLVRSLTPGDVVVLRKAYQAGGVSIRALACRFGFPAGTVRSAVSGHTWAWITDPPPCAARERARP